MKRFSAASLAAAASASIPDPYSMQEDETSTDDESDDVDDEMDEYSDEDVDGGGRNGGSREYTEIKEQMYQDKLAELKRQLEELQGGNLPEYSKRLRRLEGTQKERVRVNAVIKELEEEMVEQDFVNEKKASAREYEEHKVFLREQLIAELEEKQKMIEAERYSMELTGDSMDLKPITTRKLRRRANESANSAMYGNTDKRGRGKPLTFNQSINYQLDDSDILDDLKIINKNKAFSMHSSRYPSGSSGSSGGNGSSAGGGGGGRSESSARGCNDDFSYGGGGGGRGVDCRVVEGKLFYEKRWYRRGQSIIVEPRQGDKYPAMISAIGTDAIWVRRQLDNSKTRIYLAQIIKGKISIKRRGAA